MNSTNLHSTLTFTRRALALTALVGAGCLGVAAQQTPDTSANATAKLDLTMPAVDSAATFSSSSTDNNTVVAANRFNFVDVAAAMQPPPRRYGRPRYRGSNTNADGSNKYAFIAGVGFTQPVGNTYHYFTPSYSYQVGGGRNFSNTFGTLIQFDWDNVGVNHRTLQQASYIFTGDGRPEDFGLDATGHTWSLSVDPTFNLTPQSTGAGFYAVGGVGFYHKTTTFTVPQTGVYCDIYGYCYQYQANTSFPGGKYTSNAPGFNGGFGFTYKISRFSGQRFYAEARYVVTLNKQRYGATLANASTYGGNNFFPANSNRTTYVPVKVGIRF